MAQMIVMRDDLDGTIDATVKSYAFTGPDGDSYEIDLTGAHYSEFQHVLAPYRSAGRLVARARKRPGPRPGTLRAVAGNGHAKASGDHGIVGFKCPECEFVAANPQGLGAHRRAAHGITGSSPATVAKRRASEASAS